MVKQQLEADQNAAWSSPSNTPSNMSTVTSHCQLCDGCAGAGAAETVPRITARNKTDCTKN